MSENVNIVAIGAFSNDNTQGNSSGHVRIYQWIGSTWAQVGSDINGEASGDYLGYNLSLSPDGYTVAVGANENDGNGSNSGHVRVYDLSALLSINNINLDNINIYPNPVKDKIHVSLNSNKTLQELKLYNSLGQLIKSSVNSMLNVENECSGVYFLQVITNKGQATKRIIIE